MKTKENIFFGLTYDRVFKAVALNEERDYRFLNMILSDILEENITVIEAEAYEVKVDSTLEKVKILDILAKTSNDEVVNIELNNSFSSFVIERNVMYYMSLLNKEFKHKNKIRNRVKRILQINLNFNKVGNHLKEYIKIYNVTEKEVYYDRFEIINVNVLKYKKIWYDKIIEGDKEHIYIVSLVSDKNELEKLGTVDGLIKEVGNKVFNLNEDEKIRDQIEREEDARIIYRNEIDYAKSEGHQEGVEEGIEKGKKEGIKEGFEEGKISIVKNLLQTNEVSIKTIAQASQLTEEEVLKIKKDLAKNN